MSEEKNEYPSESAPTDHFLDEGAVSRNHGLPPQLKQGPPNVPADVLRKWTEWLRNNYRLLRKGEAECWRRFEQDQQRLVARKQELSKKKLKARSKRKMQKASRKANRG